MRLDHIAYRVKNRENAIKFLKFSLGYDIDPDLKEGFDILFDDATFVSRNLQNDLGSGSADPAARFIKRKPFSVQGP